jgi:uncharacterized protein YycO
MSTPFDPSILRPGDSLLYRPSTLFGLIIKYKTWARFSHVEVYIGGDQSVGAREKGVRVWPLRLDHLGCVLRPYCPPNMESGLEWFYSKANGQGYDYLGLLCFTLAAKQGSPNKQFCSELGTRFYRAGQLNIFAPHWDADRIAPGNFLMTPAFEIAWTDGKLL